MLCLLSAIAGTVIVVEARLLWGLPRLVMVMMMTWLVVGRHIACCWRSWRDTVNSSIWNLTVERSSVIWLVRWHPFLIMRRCIRNSTRTIQTNLLSVIQKIWESSFLTCFLINCFRNALRSSMSRRSRMPSLFAITFFAWMQVLSLCLILYYWSSSSGRWYILLTVSHGTSSFWNRCRILCVATIRRRLTSCSTAI